MYTIIGLIVFVLCYIIMNVAVLKGFGGELQIVIILMLNVSSGIVLFVQGTFMNDWILLVGLALLVLAFKQYQILKKYYPY